MDNPKLFYPEEIIEAFKYAAEQRKDMLVRIPTESNNMLNASRIYIALGGQNSVSMGFSSDYSLTPWFSVEKGYMRRGIYNLIYVKTWQRDSIEVEDYAKE